MAVSDWSTTANSNTSVGAVSIAEGWSPASVNNAIRELMAQIRTWYDEVPTDAEVQPKDATLTALAALATAANKLVYATGSDTFATTDLTAFARTLLDDADAATMRSTLGTIGLTATSGGDPGYVKLNLGSFNLIVQWGRGTVPGAQNATITYPTAFTTFAICVVSGGPVNPANDGNVRVTQASGLTTQGIACSENAGSFYSWIAIGV